MLFLGGEEGQGWRVEIEMTLKGCAELCSNMQIGCKLTCDLSSHLSWTLGQVLHEVRGFPGVEPDPEG